MEDQTKEEMLRYISDSIQKYSSFDISELGLDGEPIVGEIGSVKGSAHTFYHDRCVCDVFKQYSRKGVVDSSKLLSENIELLYSSMDILYLENVKTAVDRWVEIKSKENV